MELIETLKKSLPKKKKKYQEYALPEEETINLLKEEPTWNIEELDGNNTFNPSEIVGKWPGDESVELLLEKLAA